MSTYDVEMERTDEKAKSPYLTRKDVFRLIIGLLVFLVLMYPIYVLLMGNAQAHVCATNFKQMFNGINLYATENTDRLPPVYVTSETDAPLVSSGAVYSWVNLIDGYVRDDTVFTCPAAEKSEGVPVHSSTGTVISLTYGMYAPMGGEPIDQIDNKDSSVLLGETVNNGYGKTLDSDPFKDASGNRVSFDAFCIGYDDSNLLPTDKSKYISRLAFYNTDTLVFPKKNFQARHRDGVHVLSVSGRLRFIKPDQAIYNNDGNIASLWKISKSRRFRN